MPLWRGGERNQDKLLHLLLRVGGSGMHDAQWFNAEWYLQEKLLDNMNQNYEHAGQVNNMNC